MIIIFISITTSQPTAVANLVSGQELLEIIFPSERSRPSISWPRESPTLCNPPKVPFIPIGQLVWYDVDAVRTAISERQVTVKKLR